MKKQLFLIALVALFTGSCKVVGNLYPLSRNEKDLIFKNELIGKWVDSTDPSGYYVVDTVNGQNGKLYKIEIVSLNKDAAIPDTNRFLGNLVMISGWYYLDCWLDLENEFNNTDKSYVGLVIAHHFIFRLSFPATNRIEMAAPDGEELIKLIDQKKIPLKYAQLNEDAYLILDKSAMLQKGVAESKKYHSLYKNNNILRRSE